MAWAHLYSPLTSVPQVWAVNSSWNSSDCRQACTSSTVSSFSESAGNDDKHDKKLPLDKNYTQNNLDKLVGDLAGDCKVSYTGQGFPWRRRVNRLQQHHQLRVAGEGRSVILVPWPRRAGLLPRSAGEQLESCQTRSSHGDQDEVSKCLCEDCSASTKLRTNRLCIYRCITGEKLKIRDASKAPANCSLTNLT